MGKLGVLAFVDTLVVLRDKRMWRQSDADLDMPGRPRSFNLGGESRRSLPFHLENITRGIRKRRYPVL